jgi:riboflavin kinase/FMN adenylyltransferase
VINFSHSFSKIGAEDFAKDILVKKLKPRYVYIGKNFHFGRNASGDYRLLKRIARENDFKLRVFKVIKVDGYNVSSSYIRKLISSGNLKLAQRLLSHPVSILGNIVRGISVGKYLGFPTANIDPHHEILPPTGIYAVRIFFKKKRLKGLCYIGTNPTIKRKRRKKIDIEVFIFNFKKNIYGQYLEVQFIQKIRNEKKFKNPQDLKKAIKKDIIYSKKLFSRH